MDSERTKKVRKSWRKHEITVVLIDVGRNMAAVSNERSQTALDLAKETIDWIITRKIFSESVDEFTLVLFGSDETRNSCLHGIGNIFFCEEELQTAQIDWLRKIENEFKLSSDAEGDYLNALIVAIEYIRLSLETMEEAEKASVTARNILILSNLAGSKADTSNTRIDEINAVVNGIKALDINLNIIGLSSVFLLHNTVSNCEQSQESRPSTNEHDFTLDSSKGFIKMEDGEKVVRQILRDVGGTAFSFSEALPMLQHFIPRTSDVRGQRFYFELAEDFRLPLMLYKKVQENNLKMKFAKYDSRTDLEIKRETVFEKPADKSQCGSQIPHCSANQTLTKADVVKGYLFGKSVMPFNEEDEKEYGWKRETRCLKLIQFTKRSNILQQYLMDGAAYYCIPDYENQEACTAVAALVDGMIAENVVALVRFVYNASSVPRLCGLFPRLNKKGAHIFLCIPLPFYDDVRGLEFPPLDDPHFQPKEEQKRAIEAYVHAMDLMKAETNPETGEPCEALRSRDVPDPRIQQVCSAIKFKALHPNEPVPDFPNPIVSEILTPKPALLSKARAALQNIQRKFPLEELHPSKLLKTELDIDDYSTASFSISQVDVKQGKSVPLKKELSETFRDDIKARSVPYDLLKTTTDDETYLKKEDCK